MKNGFIGWLLRLRWLFYMPFAEEHMAHDL